MPAADNINPVLARALEKKGYAQLTEVQEAVLAPETDGTDLLVSAQTGSGKTVAFGLAIAPTILGNQEKFGPAVLPQALIVAPTRELAIQVQRELTWLFGEAKGRIASCVGGMDPRAERRALSRGAHIVVGTPGRLRDHIERGGLDMSGLRAVVLDEADEMLDFGFREDLEFILDTAPAERRTLMFSATVPRTISKMAKRYQKDAQRISTVSEREQHSDIEYRALTVAPSDKENAIINVLRYYEAERAIVFCKTRQDVNRLSSRFGNRGFSVVALSGELSQNERTHALQALRDGRARVCIATDVAARGIDLPGLELVIHADLPTNSDVLKHRSGRTGRAGQKGICALVVPHTMRKRAQRLLQGARLEAEWAAAPSLKEIDARDQERLHADPLLTQSYSEKDLSAARDLLGRHGAEQVAAAFLQQRAAKMPSAEELIDAPLQKDTRAKREKQKRDREPFGESVWFIMTAGKKQQAEPSWLLPIICRLGHVTKREVGAIKIGETETRFEIRAKDAGRFIDAVKASGGGEKSIRITQAEGHAEGWVPEVTSLDELRPPSKKKEGDRSKAKPRKKEKWSRARKNAAKKQREQAKSSDKKKARKSGPSSDGMDALIRKPKKNLS